jgi:hypothetical protein
MDLAVGEPTAEVPSEALIVVVLDVDVEVLCDTNSNLRCNGGGHSEVAEHVEKQVQEIPSAARAGVADGHQGEELDQVTLIADGVFEAQRDIGAAVR